MQTQTILTDTIVEPESDQFLLDSTLACRLGRADARTSAMTSGRVADPPSDELAVHDGLDSPTHGRWTIPTQRAEARTTWPRRARSWLVRGALVVADETTLELEVAPDSTRTALGGLGFRGTLAARDRIGRWHFEGEVTTAGRVHPMTIEVAYHGVFRSGARDVVWLVLAGGGVGSAASRATRRLVPRLSGGLNAVLDA